MSLKFLNQKKGELETRAETENVVFVDSFKGGNLRFVRMNEFNPK